MSTEKRRCWFCNSEVDEEYGRANPGYITYTDDAPEGESRALVSLKCPVCKGTGYITEEGL